MDSHLSLVDSQEHETPQAPVASSATQLAAYQTALSVSMSTSLQTWLMSLVFLPIAVRGAAWAAFVLINLGVWLAGMGATLAAPAWIILAGRAAEAGAALAFALHAWPRVKPPGAI